jgi:hypothetical protein
MWNAVKEQKNKKKPKQCHEIEPNPSKDRAMHEGDNPSFWDKFKKCSFLDSTIHIFVFKANTEVFSYWAVETLGD